MTSEHKILDEELAEERARTRDLLDAAEEAASEGALVAERLREVAQRIRLGRVDAEIAVRRSRVRHPKVRHRRGHPPEGKE